MSEFPTTARSQVKRQGSRGQYDRDAVYAIVDQALICHVGFEIDGQPYVIPTLHARQGDCLLLHGAVNSRLIQHLQAGHPVCVSMALVDGLVLGVAACSHSINYRSAVLFGRGALVEAEQDKLRALELLTERLVPGRWKEVRPPSALEMRATAIVSIAIQEASAKVRDGPPSDSRPDWELPVWAGVQPIRQVAGPPVRADYTASDISLPGSLTFDVDRQADSAAG